MTSRATMSAGISIIIPVLDEADIIGETLLSLRDIRYAGNEIIVVDGGSRDGTAEIAAPLADRLLHAQSGRAIQMNAGAASADGEILLFLHADTRLPPGSDEIVTSAMQNTGATWGRFDIRLTGKATMFRLIGFFMNWRSRLTGIATGDQCIFVRRDVFEAIGGYPELPLMEDIAISRQLKRKSRPVCIRNKVLSSSRRWQEAGILRTILLMWYLRLSFFLGADPQRLLRHYR